MGSQHDVSPDAPHGGLAWPDVRAWLQAHPSHLYEDRALLEELGLMHHGRNVVAFGPAALTRLEAVVERESGARKQIEIKAWTAEQLDVFLEAIEPHRLSPAFHLASYTGMRRGEVLGLRWKDLDLDEKRLSPGFRS